MQKQLLPPLSDHERRVREMMIGFGQAVPEAPGIPPLDVLKLRGRLMVEEVFEFLEAAGLQLCYVEPDSRSPVTLKFDQTTGEVGSKSNMLLVSNLAIKPDMEGMLDALGDLSVVGPTGTAAALGVRMTPILENIDANNLQKLATGKLDENGKFRKSPDHVPPDHSHALASQGWVEPSRRSWMTKAVNADKPAPCCEARDGGMRPLEDILAEAARVWASRKDRDTNDE